MAIIELYTSPLCGYCHAAKRLLDAKGATFVEVDLSRSPERRSEMQTRANGRHTVPQIFIDDVHPGSRWTLRAGRPAWTSEPRSKSTKLPAEV